MFPLLIPGGVADPDGKWGFVANDSEGISCLDLETGHVQWTLASPGTPLLAYDSKVVVLCPVDKKSNQVRVEIRDSSAMGRLVSSNLVEFASWVNVGLDYGYSFSASAVTDRKAIYLRWKAYASQVHGGGMPATEIAGADGVVFIDPPSNTVLPTDSEILRIKRFLPGPLKDLNTLGFWNGTDWCDKPFVAGDAAKAFAFKRANPTPGEESGKLFLRTWDLGTGEEKPAAELQAGSHFWMFVPADSNYVVVRHSGDQAMSIFSLETGRLTGKVIIPNDSLSHLEGMSMRVAGPRLFYSTAAGIPKGNLDLIHLERRKLKAFDLKTGKQIWDCPISPNKRLRPLQ